MVQTTKQQQLIVIALLICLANFQVDTQNELNLLQEIFNTENEIDLFKNNFRAEFTTLTNATKSVLQKKM